MGNSLVHNSVSSGLFGKTRQAVLALLYGQPDKSFYTRQILDAVKAGRGAVQRELESLTESGIIIREVRGRQVYYRANEECSIFDELKNIVRKTFGVADIIREALAPLSKKTRAAFIFGSVARSADVKASDIDIMIIGDVSFAAVSVALSPPEKTLRREINPVVYPPDEFRQKAQDNHFIKSVLAEAKIFIIGDESELDRLAE